MSLTAQRKFVDLFGYKMSIFLLNEITIPLEQDRMVY